MKGGTYIIQFEQEIEREKAVRIIKLMQDIPKETEFTNEAINFYAFTDIRDFIAKAFHIDFSTGFIIESEVEGDVIITFKLRTPVGWLHHIEKDNEYHFSFKGTMQRVNLAHTRHTLIKSDY